MKSVTAFKWKILTLLFVLFSALSTQAAYHEYPTNTVEVQKPWKQRLKQEKETINQKFDKFFTKSNNDDKNISRLAIIGAVLSLISVLAILLAFVYIPIILIAPITGILGMLVSKIALHKIEKSKEPEKHTRSKKLARTGFVWSLVSFVVSLLVIGIIVLAVYGIV